MGNINTFSYVFLKKGPYHYITLLNKKDALGLYSHWSTRCGYKKNPKERRHLVELLKII